VPLESIKVKVLVVIPADKPMDAPNYRINIGFVMSLAPMVDEFHCVKAYQRDKVLMSAKSLYEKYHPDAMVLMAHSDALNGYLKGIPCLKVMIAVDYYKVVQREKYWWYKNNEFDLVIQRQVYDPKHFKEKVGIPSVWLPYCADDKEFAPGEWKVNNKIGFIGSVNEVSYPIRHKAITSLGNLMDNLGKVVGPKYPETLRKYRSMLTTTYKFISYSPHAKFFEIIASGSIALTNPFDHWNLLFPDGRRYWVEFNNDCSDVVDKAQWIINHKEECLEMREMAYREFQKYHTNRLRLVELRNILQSALEGKEIPLKWSI